MKRWILILLLSMIGISSRSHSNEFQITLSNIVSNKKSELEDLKLKVVAYNYLKNTHNIETINMPNNSPLDITGLNRISDLYGMRYHPIKKKYTMHHGIDFSGKSGTKIFATADGVIEEVRYKSGYGKTIVINHGNNIKTLYAHLKSYNVKVGQQVFATDYIGKLGNTGASTGPHLHYEVIINNKSVNPALFYIDKNITKKELLTKLNFIKNVKRISYN